MCPDRLRRGASAAQPGADLPSLMSAGTRSCGRGWPLSWDRAMLLSLASALGQGGDPHGGLVEVAGRILDRPTSRRIDPQPPRHRDSASAEH